MPMNLGQKREYAKGAAAVAATRKFPRPVKRVVTQTQLVDGKEMPFLAFDIKVHIEGQKVAVLIDREGKEHTYPVTPGQIDLTSSNSVTMIQYDTDGEQIPGFLPVLHDIQHRYAGKSDAGDAKYSWQRATGKTSGHLRRKPFTKSGAFSPHESIVWFQSLADSPDAIWIDGKEPTVKDLQAQEDEYAEKKSKKAGSTRRSVRDSEPEPEPVGATDGGGGVEDDDTPF